MCMDVFGVHAADAADAQDSNSGHVVLPNFLRQ
jgi:hypothetical protein